MGLFGLTPSDVTGGLGDLLSTGVGLWDKNQQYQLEKKRLEMEAATQRNQAAKTTAAAADVYNQAMNAVTMQNLAKWGAIAVVGLVGAIVASRLLGGLLKKV